MLDVFSQSFGFIKEMLNIFERDMKSPPIISEGFSQSFNFIKEMPNIFERDMKYIKSSQNLCGGVFMSRSKKKLLNTWAKNHPSSSKIIFLCHH